MHDSSDMAAAGYVVPRYQATQDATWFHVLHGNIPNHQIDFMYCPEVPQGLITPTHFSHMTRLMKYIEPQTHASHAFAIGNLSRDDTQHEPGHGGLGIIFGMRIGGATDHAGRQNPPFAHGVLTVDRELNHAALLEAAATFYRHVMYAGEAQSTTSDFYRAYVRTMLEVPDQIVEVLSRYLEDFNDLPRLTRSRLGWDWEADEDAVPRRVTIVHVDGESFGAIALVAARIGSLLYRSSIKWTAITTGREADIPGGVSVRFVSERDITAEDRRSEQFHRMDELPSEEAALARDLFGARPRGGEERRYVGWRERFAAPVSLEDTGSRRTLPLQAALADREPAPRAPAPASERERARERAREREREAPHKYTGAGTEIMARAPARDLVERGIISEADAMPEGARHAAATPAAEPTSQRTTPSQPAPRARSAAAKPDGTKAAAPPAAAKASAASATKPAGAKAGRSTPPPGAPAPEWRDVDGAAASTTKKAAAAAAADDIEVTVDSPSSSKTWLWVLLGVAAVAGGAVAVVKMPERFGLSGVPIPGMGAPTPAPQPSPTLAPPTSPTTGAGTPTPPTSQDTSPGALQTSGPNTGGSPAAKAPPLADTGEAISPRPPEKAQTPSKGSGKGKPPASASTKKKGSIFEDPLVLEN